jgi:hypothetical protein
MKLRKASAPSDALSIIYLQETRPRQVETTVEECSGLQRVFLLRRWRLEQREKKDNHM